VEKARGKSGERSDLSYERNHLDDYQHGRKIDVQDASLNHRADERSLTRDVCEDADVGGVPFDQHADPAASARANTRVGIEVSQFVFRQVCNDADGVKII